MGTYGILLCPILVGRDELLALADRRLAGTEAGAGQVLFLAGEAGIGKTRLLDSVNRRAGLLHFDVVRGAAFPRDLELAGGLVLDVARNLSASPDPAHRVTGERMAARLLGGRVLGGAQDGDGDRHRQRRLLVLDLAQMLAGLAAEPGTVLALEDLHWADDLSLEVLGQLARQLPQRRMLVIGTYRSDELYPRVPMREWRARLLTQRLAEEARLPRLTRQETTAMIRAVLGSAPTDIGGIVYDRSDGIPLHVEEFLAAIGQVPVGIAPVPDTLADAVLARAEALTESARQTAFAAAVIGRSFDFDLLVDVAGEPAEAVADSVRELRERHFVVLGADPTTYDFRHALIRDALYADAALPLRRRLHARVAEAASKRGYRDAFTSVHFEHANLPAQAYGHAMTAASQAAALSCHCEAFELYRRAQRCQPTTTPAAGRAALLAVLAAEAAAIDENVVAAQAYEQAHRLFLEAGRRVDAAALLAPLVAVRHLLGDGLTERATRLSAGLDTLDSIVDADEGGAKRVRVQLLAGLSAAHMLDRRLEEAIAYGERAQALAAEVGDESAELNASVTLGSVLIFAGRMDDGWRLLEAGVTRAVGHRHESEAARAYRMIGTSASVLVEYDRARRWLTEGIEYAERVELWNHRHYMAAHLAHVHWAQGDWPAAQELAASTLADGRGGVTTRITALHVLGYVALGRGDWTAARGYLDEAREHGEHMAELQRLSPALWGLAEVALLSSEVDTAIVLCERGLAESARVDDAAYLFPFVVTGTRALLRAADPLAAGRWVDRTAPLLHRRGIPGTLAAVDHARGLVALAGGHTGVAREALARADAQWRRRGRFWEGAQARLDLARCAVRSRRTAQASSLVAEVRDLASSVGAVPLLAAADAVLSAPAANLAAEPWQPLTAREFEVATLVATGLTNRQVAAQLVVSPRTVSAHVEHILAKLGATRRAEIAAWATTVRRPDRG